MLRQLAAAVALALAAPTLGQASAPASQPTTAQPTYGFSQPAQPVAPTPTPTATPTQTPTAPQPQAPTTTTTQPPSTPNVPAATAPVIVERSDRRSTLAIVATDAVYGAAAGALVGGGVALIVNNDSWGRDLMIGTGAGILIGTVVGVVDASNRGPDNRLAVRDGQGALDRDPPLAGVHVVANFSRRF